MRFRTGASTAAVPAVPAASPHSALSSASSSTPVTSPTSPAATPLPHWRSLAVADVAAAAHRMAQCVPAGGQWRLALAPVVAVRGSGRRAHAEFEVLSRLVSPLPSVTGPAASAPPAFARCHSVGAVGASVGASGRVPLSRQRSAHSGLATDMAAGGGGGERQAAADAVAADAVGARALAAALTQPRRYKDFAWLHYELSRRLPALPLPALPEKVRRRRQSAFSGAPVARAHRPRRRMLCTRHPAATGRPPSSPTAAAACSAGCAW